MSKPRGVTIAGNWKMNHLRSETTSFFSKLGQSDSFSNGAIGQAMKESRLSLGVFPPTLSLDTAQECARSSAVWVGSQNTHWKESGAYTGEISAAMLKETGIQRTLVAHSERRQYFGETDESAALRTSFLLAQGFEVMLCIGETLEERKASRTTKILLRQLSSALQKGDVDSYLDGRLTIAYEPVWAIGTGLTASPAQAEEAHQIIRKWIWDTFGMEASGRTPILYGGSVKPDNVDELLACPNIDGALVGGASLKADSFLALAEAGARA